MSKVKNILIVDDSDATIFFNKTMISRSDCAEHISTAKNGQEALKYIKSTQPPELILLDINMPIMNGWEFLNAYQELDSAYQKSIIILMISTPLLEKDKSLIANIPYVQEFYGKMVSKEIIQDIIAKNFCAKAFYAKKRL